MSLIFLLILGYLIYLLVRPMWKVWSISRRVRKGDFSAFGDIFGQPGSQKHTSAYGSDGRRRQGWTAPTVRRKKIGKDIGEYVKFQEVETTQTTSSANEGTRVKYTREEQITDIEWEEI